MPLLFHFRSQNFYLPFLEAPNQKSLSEHTRNFLLPFSFQSKHRDRRKPWRSDKGTTQSGKMALKFGWGNYAARKDLAGLQDNSENRGMCFSTSLSFVYILVR